MHTLEIAKKVKFKLEEMNSLQISASVVFVGIKDNFFDAVQQLANSDPSALPYSPGELPYYEEENAAYLIPSIGSFDPKYISFQDFIEYIKPFMLEAEMGRFMIDIRKSKWTIDKNTFDMFFFLEIRDSISCISAVAG